MDSTKSILLSKSVWGSLIAIAAVIASNLGFDLGDTSGLANDIVALLGTVFAIYGRIVAVDRIK